MSALIHYEHMANHQPIINFVNAVVDNQLKHYASDLFPELQLKDEETFNISLMRAQQVCATLDLPIEHHFKKIYRTDGNRIYCDYRLSHAAYVLIGINGDVNHIKVANIQMELVNLLVKDNR